MVPTSSRFYLHRTGPRKRGRDPLPEATHIRQPETTTERQCVVTSGGAIL